jgi:hypothetical protein
MAIEELVERVSLELLKHSDFPYRSVFLPMPTDMAYKFWDRYFSDVHPEYSVADTSIFGSEPSSMVTVLEKSDRLRELAEEMLS